MRIAEMARNWRLYFYWLIFYKLQNIILYIKNLPPTLLFGSEITAWAGMGWHEDNGSWSSEYPSGWLSCSPRIWSVQPSPCEEIKYRLALRHWSPLQVNKKIKTHYAKTLTLRETLLTPLRKTLTILTSPSTHLQFW